MTIDPRILELAEEILTTPQLEVWDRHHRRGWSFDTISVDLLIHRSTVRSRYDGAWLKMVKHGVRFTPDGRPYLEETQHETLAHQNATSAVDRPT